MALVLSLAIAVVRLARSLLELLKDAAIVFPRRPALRFRLGFAALHCGFLLTSLKITQPKITYGMRNTRTGYNTARSCNARNRLGIIVGNRSGRIRTAISVRILRNGPEN